MDVQDCQRLRSGRGGACARQDRPVVRKGEGGNVECRHGRGERSRP